MRSNLLLEIAAGVVLVAAGAWIVLEGSSVSAQTRGADAIKMFDKDNDGTIDLEEAKAAAAAMFDKLDLNHDGTLTQEELGDRATVCEDYRQARTRLNSLLWTR